jgi:hypothetical protein
MEVTQLVTIDNESGKDFKCVIMSERLTRETSRVFKQTATKITDGIMRLFPGYVVRPPGN